MKALASAILVLITFCSFGQNIDSTEHILVEPEPVPSYPGGTAEMARFIRKHRSHPRDSRSTHGKVYVTFMVNEDGSLSDFKIVKGLTDSLNKNAITTLTKMPKWIPAKRDDKAIPTRMIVVIAYD